MLVATADLDTVSALVLGAVEGLTEYLPISSTGHLLVAEHLLGLHGTGDAQTALDAYAVCIQAGAILAVLALYPRRVAQIASGVFDRETVGRRLFTALVVAFVPAAIIGFALGDRIQTTLFGVWPVGAAWLAGGIALLWFVRSKFAAGGARLLEHLTARDAALIGIAQVAALWPGVSRSLVTITAALALGYTIGAAVEFSFLLGLITLGAATAYEALKDGDLIVANFGYLAPILGLVVAFATAVMAIRWMVTWLQQHGLGVFAWYRMAIGALALAVVAVR